MQGVRAPGRRKRCGQTVGMIGRAVFDYMTFLGPCTISSSSATAAHTGGSSTSLTRRAHVRHSLVSTTSHHRVQFDPDGIFLNEQTQELFG